jgi:hypothetical protein
MATVNSAGAVAKSQMDAQLGSPYTHFVVHTLECQITGIGIIYKAAVSAKNPITGNRDGAHITFYNAPSESGLGSADFDGSGSIIAARDDDGSGSTVISPSGRQLYDGRRLGAVSAGPTVLDFAITPEKPAAVDTSFQTAVTNPSALQDPLVQILGLRASTALVVSAVVIVGAFLSALIAFTIYFTYTHWNIMATLRDHWPTLHVALPHVHHGLPDDLYTKAVDSSKSSRVIASRRVVPMNAPVNAPVDSQA